MQAFGETELSTYVDLGAPGGAIWVAPDLWMRETSLVVDRLSGYRVEMSVEKLAEGSVGVATLTVRTTDGEPIDSDTVRSISFRPAFIAAAMNAINWSRSGKFELFPIAQVLEELQPLAQPNERGRYQMPEGDALRGLVAVVRAARLLRIGPATLLREQLGLPATTARYWVERVGHLGLLEQEGESP